MDEEEQRRGRGGAVAAAEEVGAIGARGVGAELRQRQADGGRGAEERDGEEQVEQEETAELARAPEDLQRIQFDALRDEEGGDGRRAERARGSRCGHLETAQQRL